MNGAHWHLMVNHLPLIFPLVGLIVLITALISRSESVRRTAYLIFILGSLAAVIAMATGDGAEEIAKRLAGVTHTYIERHEETAETFALLSYILGGASLIGLWASFKQKGFSNIVSFVTLVFSVIVLIFAKQTGTTGGEIRHDEIRSESSR